MHGEAAIVRESPNHLGVGALFLVLTAGLTYPQVRYFATSVPFHSDPYFSMWRLGWVAHALVHAPRTLFDANIFYPEHTTLAYSDAMLLPGVVFAPWFWAGVNPVVTYNSALFAAFALSGWAMFALARELTGDPAAAIVAGVIFAFAPYRFTHYMHLELQMVFWIPLALLALHRILACRGGPREGLWLGAAVAGQILSSIYGGVFLATYAAAFAPCAWLAAGRRPLRQIVVPALLAAAVAAAVAWPYAAAYRRAERTVGTRSADDVGRYSAAPPHFLAAPAMNRLYGRTAILDPLRADEMNLFPGLAAVGLAALGLVWGRGRMRFAYAAALAFALVMTRGTNGSIYAWLFTHVALFQGLRSPARFDILVTLCLAVLSGYGVAAASRALGGGRRARLAGAAVCALLIVEYASAPALTPVPPPTAVDRALAAKPRAVVVELPLRSDRGIWGSFDWLYMYQGLNHFQPMLNGYSGYAPASFDETRDVMASFPDDPSVAFLRRRQVDYVVVRVGLLEPQEAAGLLARIRERGELSLDPLSSTGPDGDALFAVAR